MKTLIATVGLPRSGKTTWAVAYSTGNGAAIVSPDAIRLAMHGQRYIPEAEPSVWVMAKHMVQSLFLAGHDVVILDATNTTRKRRDEWKSDKWRTVFHVIPTTELECLRRAANDEVIKPVIRKMAAQFEPLVNYETLIDPIGATGAFPDGAIDPVEDEGELKMAIAADKLKGVVLLNFGKPIAWIGLPRKEAIEMADSLRFQASKLC